MSKTKRVYIFALLFAVLALYSPYLFAQTPTPTPNLPNLGEQIGIPDNQRVDIKQLSDLAGSSGRPFEKIVNWIIGIFWVIVVGFFIWAAFLFLSSGGSEEKVSEAKKRILYGLIAAVVALLSTGVKIITYNLLSPGAIYTPGTGDIGIGGGADRCPPLAYSPFTDVVINQKANESNDTSGMETTSRKIVTLTLGDQTCHTLTRKTHVYNTTKSGEIVYDGFQGRIFGWNLCEGRENENCPEEGKRYCVYAQFEYRFGESKVESDCITYSSK